MGLSTSTVWEVRTTGSDSSGGGFVTGASGTDYSQQDAAQFSGTDLSATSATGSAPVVSSGSHNFAAADVGNLIQITAGTNWTTGFYQIVSVASNNATLDRACASVASPTSGTWAEGGALVSPGKAASAINNGHIVYVKLGTYTITTASTNVSGGCLNGSGNTPRWIGYNTTRAYGNTDTKPILILNSGVTTAVIAGGNGHTFYNFEMDGASQTTSKFCSGSGATFYRCSFKNFTAASNYGQCFYCTATGFSASAFPNTSFFCEAYANTATPFNLSSNGSGAFFGIASGNTGASTDGFSNSGCALMVGCSSISNGRHGFNVAFNGVLINCIAESNTGWGASTSSPNASCINLATYNNGSGRVTGFTSPLESGGISYTPSAFVNAGSNNYALNNTAGAGALLRGAGFPVTFPRALSSAFLDIGAVQHQDPGGVIIVEDD